ncbi:MAG: SDR family oxidoreductase [Myxococcales bacterium]|nr:SDR family oxidoreductase [Myxococcales bacterium]MDH3844963.1 SDR family oxidoreductase [Myxococcales bacterium]
MTDRGILVITGASTGIGAACAIGLAKRGYTVFAGVRKREDGSRLRADGGDNLIPLTIDVTDQTTIDAAAERVQRERQGRPLRGLFNNAGISVNGPLEFIKPEDLRWQLEVNCVGQLAVTQAFLPMILESKGRIITTGSVGGFVTTPMLGPYCMSKYAIEAFSDALRVELAPQGVHVVLLQPASIATPIWDKGRDGAEEMISHAPPAFDERYGRFVSGIRKFAEEGKSTAADPKVVLDAVIHALESPRPKTRYVMGTGAGQRKFLRMLPDRLRDRALLKAFGF